MSFLTSWTHKLNNHNTFTSTHPAPTPSPIPNFSTHPNPNQYQAVPTHYFPPPKPKVPPRPDEWPIPTFRLRVDDLNHPGAQLFFKNVNANEALKDACVASFVWLYTLESVPRNVEVIHLILRSMPGVAHTTGSSIYKEIHFSLDHIVNCASRAKDEILGVLTHEVVHCFQYNGKGTAPGGLIEGIADFVRLRASLPPPHWRPRGSPSEKWDSGYDMTAYFLSYLESQYGTGLIAHLNLTLRERTYEEDAFWKELTGRRVERLWKRYCEFLEEEKARNESYLKGYGSAVVMAPPVPTHNRPEGEKKAEQVMNSAETQITDTKEWPATVEVKQDTKMEDGDASENSTDSEMVVVEHKDKGKEKE